MYFSFSNTFKWLAKLPSDSSNVSFNRLNSTQSLTIKIDIIPSLTRLSNLVDSSMSRIFFIVLFFRL